MDIEFTADNVKESQFFKEEAVQFPPRERICASSGSQIEQIRCLLEMRTKSANLFETKSQVDSNVCSDSGSECESSEDTALDNIYQIVFQPAMSMFTR